MGVNPRMEHSSFLHHVLLLAILVTLKANQANATKFPSDKGPRPTVGPSTYNPWYSTTRPWWSTTWDPYTTTRSPYSTTRSPWDTTTRPWQTTTAYPKEGCPEGWVNSIEGCFLFYYHKYVNWHEAQYECEKVGGFLAEPKTQQQVDMLKSIAFLEDSLVDPWDKPNGTWWIGLTDQGHEGRWIWQHDTEDAYNTDWIWGCPVNGVNNLDCAMMEKNFQCQWRDALCDRNYAAPICQRDQTSPTPTPPTPSPYPTTTWRPYPTSTWPSPTTTRRPYPTTSWRPWTTPSPYPTTTWRPYTTHTWRPWSTTSWWRS